MSYSTRSLLPPSARRRLKSSLTHLPHPLRSGYGRVVVLCYHSVHPSKEFSSATPELFADQIAWLKDNCRLVSFSDVLKQARVSHKREQPVVAVTLHCRDAVHNGFSFSRVTV